MDIKELKKLKLHQILQRLHPSLKDNRQFYLLDFGTGRIYTFRPRYQSFDQVETICTWDFSKESLGKQSSETQQEIIKLLERYQ